MTEFRHPPVQVAISERWQKGVVSVHQGSDSIYTELQSALLSGRGSLIGRFGSTELTNVCLSLQKDGGGPLEERAIILERYSGIFPATPETLNQWFTVYMASISQVNTIVAAWYTPLARPEWTLLDTFCPMAHRVPLRALEAYYSAPTHHWTRILAEQKVCVVSSFAETMKTQCTKAEEIWPQCPTLLPNAEWSFVRSFYPPRIARGQCEWPSGISSWDAAVTYLFNEVMKTGAQIVLLGCGALAMPLGARLKKEGKLCVVMGGAIQILFGIKGKRWENHEYISALFNDAWVYPDDSEIPGGAKYIEDGCYW